MSESLYLIIDAGRSHDGRLVFWGRNGSGYTKDIDNAGRYTVQDLLRIRYNMDEDDILLTESDLLRYLLSRPFKPADLKRIADPTYRWKELAYLLHDYGYSTDKAEVLADARLKTEPRLTVTQLRREAYPVGGVA